MITCIFIAGQFWLQQDDPQLLIRVDSITYVNEDRVDLLTGRSFYIEDNGNYTMILEALQSCKEYNE